LQAQLMRNGRFEITELDWDAETFEVISAREAGLFLHRPVVTKEGSSLELIRLDTALNEVWRGFIPIDNRLHMLFSEVKDDRMFMLLKDRTSLSGDFVLVTISITSGKYDTDVIRNIIPFTATELSLTAEAALISGYFNYRPLIVYFNFHQKQSRVLPGFLNEPGELNQVRVNPDNSIDVIVSAKNFERKTCLWLRSYDRQGNLVKTIIITPEDNKSLIFGSSMPAENGEQVISGVYGRYSEYSRGIFVAVVNALGEYTIRYYNFSELQRFFNYMKASREKRIKNRIERRKINCKKIKFNYRLLVHELIPYNDQYIMIGEAFYPHYSYTTSNTPFRTFSSSSPSMLNPLMRDGMVFDGYQYTHAVVLGFDKNGKLMWDNSFEINDVRSMKLEKLVKIQPEKDRIILLYLFDNILRSKIIRNAEVLEGKSQDNLEATTQTKSKVKWGPSSSNQLDYWYDHYFFALGTRVIKRGKVTGRGTMTSEEQKIWFVDKLSYK